MKGQKLVDENYQKMKSVKRLLDPEMRLGGRILDYCFDSLEENHA